MNLYIQFTSKNGLSIHEVHTVPKDELLTEDADLHKQFKGWSEEATSSYSTQYLITYQDSGNKTASLSVYELDRWQGHTLTLVDPVQIIDRK